MILLDYIINLSIFSLLVSTPLVIGSFIKHKFNQPFRNMKLWISLYAGVVSYILVMMSFQQDGYSYDIRYAPVILMFSYFGPIPGIITGGFALAARLLSSGNWYPAILGWTFIMVSFSLIYMFIKHYSTAKRNTYLFVTYLIVYVITVPILFNIFRNQPLFHLQYVLFVMLGVIIGSLLIESYVNLYKTIAERKKMEKTLAESEAKYRLIAENTSDLIMVLDHNQSVQYYSPSHQLVLGFDKGDLVEMDLGKLIHPDDSKMFGDCIKAMFENKGSITLEFRLIHKEGNAIEFESRCMPVKGNDDSIEHIVIVSRDISERKKAEEILLQSEKLSIVGELAAGVAHEIRNPLTTIKGFIQLYRSELGATKYNDLILSELERIEVITSELLSLGKPQAVKLDRVNLKDLLDDTLELLAPQANYDGIQFKMKSNGDAFPVIGEKNQIKQVFLNILKNSMESMENGGEIKIHLTKDQEGMCSISIEDEGCGIPEDLLPRLGEPFYSLKDKGTGLGIMICHKIIKQHHGSIHLSSMVNKGTIVEIKLPLVIE
ncbi:ATP-binding protein [Robertmurraya mangrovi]|uniref:ATP-binding protein n=1 Tax=Robertmurraya mangrovi TaxID=3098077 RepID=UPI002ACC2428|nr:ATP-binding protein [Bacillus sp. 31A1R]